MWRYVLVVLFSLFSFFSFSWIATDAPPAAEMVREYCLAKRQEFKKECQFFLKLVRKGNQQELQQQFFKMRATYKQMEVFVEYFFPFYAAKLNGPPIPFFEEAEADKKDQLPKGMQLIESYLFPRMHAGRKLNLLTEATDLVHYATDLANAGEYFEFNDATIFDALMEESYRITALGITGFDSQLALHSLAECKAALNGMQQVLHLYKDAVAQTESTQFASLQNILSNAAHYLDLHRDFNSFNRMEFITHYLNPLAQIIGGYKTAKGYQDNTMNLFYSAIRKTNTLFSPSAFDPLRFLDDNTSSVYKIQLGRKLFFEKRLSSNGQRSCASCHIPEKAFTDGLKTSMALNGHTLLLRNAPTIWNAALQRNLFVDSRSRTLEDQVVKVLNNANEMHGSAIESAKNIVGQEEYKELYAKAYPDALERKAAYNVSNAIASYERTLIALNARFDKHMNGKSVLSKSEINGFNLFMGKAKCGTCHFMPLFSGAKPPRYYYIESEVLGVPATFPAKKPVLDRDTGRYLITGAQVHLFSFKTPTLRNIALTAPYMHNGVFKTLEEVIDFYDKGGGKGLHIAPSNQSLSFDRLNLTTTEKHDIIRFLKTLTDTSGSY